MIENVVILFQAIKEHLFSTSTSVVLSSVESLPPSVDKHTAPRKTMSLPTANRPALSTGRKQQIIIKDYLLNSIQCSYIPYHFVRIAVADFERPQDL